MKPREPAASLLPRHWSPDQALAVAEFLQFLREALWSLCGTQISQAWRDELHCEQPPPSFDPDEPL